MGAMHGIRCHDDQPTWFKCRSPSGDDDDDDDDSTDNWILSVPYQQEINDIPHTIARQGSSAVRKTPFFEPFYTKMYHVSKTGSGQT